MGTKRLTRFAGGSPATQPARRILAWLGPGIRPARPGLFVLLIAAFALARPPHVSAGLTYNIINYTTTGSVTGTITTNGATGPIGLGDITNWDITINIPSFAPVTLTPADSGGAVNPANSGLTATSTSLYLTPATNSASGSFLVFLESADGPSVKWLNVFNLSTATQSATLDATTQTPLIVGTYNVADAIATAVPEPSTLVIAALGSAAGLAWARACRCRQKRRQWPVEQVE